MSKSSATVSRFRTAYSEFEKPGLSFLDAPSLTKQEFSRECDINFIVARAKRTGVVEHVNRANARFGDFTNVPTYQEALQSVNEAQAAFLEIPSHIRKQFNNDPGTFLDFIHDPKNFEQAAAMGLIIKRPADAPPVPAPAPGQTVIPGASAPESPAK